MKGDSNMSSRRRFPLVLAGLLGTAASAQNLLPNGDFTGNLASWSQFGPMAPATGSAVWDDDSGSPTVGALRIQLSDNGVGGAGLTMRNCIAVSTGSLPLPWDFGARLVIVNEVNAPEFLVAAQFYPGAGCTGTQASFQLSSTGLVAGQLDGAANTFTQFEGTRVTDPMPGGSPTASMRMAVTVATGGATTTGEAVFDRVYFGGDGTVPVTLQSFAVD